MKYLIVLISFIFLLSCTKSGKNVTLKGRVVNPVTGDGIAGTEIWLQKTAGGYNGGWKTVKKAISNGDGNFVIEKIGFAGYAAVTGVFPGEYYQLGWTQDQGVTYAGNFRIWPKKGKTMHADYYAVPYGNIKKSIKNTSCFDQNDVLVVNRKYQFSGTSNPYNSNNEVYNGCFEFIGTVYSPYPMGWHYMSGYYTKNNVTTNFSDSIYIDNGGFHEWIFEY